MVYRVYIILFSHTYPGSFSTLSLRNEAHCRRVLIQISKARVCGLFGFVLARPVPVRGRL